MQPSSVIFLALIAVWAAYFLVYWVRRREHLATARTVDDLSASMRVLQRGAPAVLPETPRSYAASPTRAVPALDALIDADPPAERVAPAGTDRRSPKRSPVSVRVTPMHPSRRLRGLTLLLGMVATVAVGAVALLALLPWWSAAAPAVLAVTAFLWLRSGVQAQTRARRSALARRAHPSEGHVVEIVQPPVAAETVETAESAPAVAEPAVEPAVEPEPAVVTPAALLVDEDDIPLTWDPVPVPRPTYAMKAKAEHPAPPPAETTPTSKPVVLGDDAAYAEPERRFAGA